MKWIIITKVPGAEQEFTGPFECYDEAMEVFSTVMGPASAYQHKYIREVFTPEERRRILAGEDGEEKPKYVYRVTVIDRAEFGEKVFEEVWDTEEAAEKAGKAWIEADENGGEYLAMDVEEETLNSSCG